MEEALGEGESTVSTIEIFLCYAREDEEYRQRLEKQLYIFQREELIRIWHDGDVSPGEEREQVIHTHLNTAQIVLLLVSPDFMASDYCYSVEMTEALERHARGKARVIPVIVRPVHWKKGPLGVLQALPKNAKPITTWRHRDEAFFDVAEGIRHVIEEIETQLSISSLNDHFSSGVVSPDMIVSSLSSQQRVNGGEKLQNASVLEQEPLPGELLTEHEACQELTDLIFPEGSSQTLAHSPSKATKDGKRPFGGLKNLRKRRLLVSAAILFALAVSLVPFLPLPTCTLTLCHSSQQSTKQPSPQDLSVELIDVVSPSSVIPNDPNSYRGSNTPPTNISAVLLAKNTVSYCDIIVAVQNLRFGGVNILIDDIALKLQQIPVTPRPLKVWTSGTSRTYNAYPYPVIYRGQSLDQLPGQLLYAAPSQNVALRPARSNHAGESNQLSIQIMSTVTAYLQFQIQVFYQIANADRVYTLTLPQTFQVVFSDASNWQEYVPQNGSFVRKP